MTHGMTDFVLTGAQLQLGREVSAQVKAFIKKYWLKLSSSKRSKIKSIIAYADSKKWINSSGSNEEYFGVQMAIWYYTDGIYGLTKFSGHTICTDTAKSVCSQCLSDESIYYNPSSDDIEFDESPIYLHESNDYVGTDMVSNITSGIGGVDLADWTIGDIELNDTAKESSADTDWLTVKWVDSNGNTLSSKSERAGVKISSSQSFKGRMGIYFNSTHAYYKVTSGKCCQFSAQQVAVATGITTQTCKLNVRCTDDVKYASIKIVKVDDDGNRVRSGVRYRIYTNLSDAVYNRLNANGNMVKDIWTDENGVVQNYMETNEKRCGYY